VRVKGVERVCNDVLTHTRGSSANNDRWALANQTRDKSRRAMLFLERGKLLVTRILEA
jgi:hypothetical protein